MTKGWIKIYRSIRDKSYYTKSAFVHLWVHILISANHEGREILWNGKTQKIGPGEFVTGRNALSAETGIDRSKIDRILKFFENEHQIEQQMTTKFRLIKVKNWSEYQKFEPQIEQQVSINCASTEQQLSTNKNDKNNKNERINTNTSPVQTSIEPVKKFNSEDYRLAELFFETIRSVIANAKMPNLKNWAEEISRINRLDERTYKQIEWLIKWLPSNSFWFKNVLSPDKLRKHFDKLALEAKSEFEKKKNKFTISSISDPTEPDNS